MMLEVLRGAATATVPNTFEALLALFSSLLGPLLTLHTAFKHVAHVVALLLKLADDIVEAMTAYIESQQQKEQLLNWVLQLLAQYRDSNLWQVRAVRDVVQLALLRLFAAAHVDCLLAAKHDAVASLTCTAILHPAAQSPFHHRDSIFSVYMRLIPSLHVLNLVLAVPVPCLLSLLHFPCAGVLADGQVAAG